MSSHATSSNAIAIPPRKNKHRATASTSTSVGSSYGSFASGSPSTPSTSKRRESLMSETFSRADYTVVNVGEEESPRLITCVKASQGFEWAQGMASRCVQGRVRANVYGRVEIFLPSYADYHFDDLERRQDPIEDIIVTDEEVKKMFPS